MRTEMESNIRLQGYVLTTTHQYKGTRTVLDNYVLLIPVPPFVDLRPLAAKGGD
jgi:hypothetical protein